MKKKYNNNKKILLKMQNTGEKEKIPNAWADRWGIPREKNPLLVAAGKKGALMRAIKLSPERRQALALHARSFRKKIIWAYKFDKCVECGKSDSRHDGRGLCAVCYYLTYRKIKRNTPVYKKSMRKYKRAWYLKNKERYKKYNAIRRERRRLSKLGSRLIGRTRDFGSLNLGSTPSSPA